MNATLGFGYWNALNSVDTTFVFEVSPDTLLGVC